MKNITKKRTLLLLLLTLCLSACADSSNNSTETTSPVADEAIALQIALDAAEQRAAYYQQLLGELREEVLTLKAEFQGERAEYESRIDELEAQLTPGEEDVSDFQYTIKEGKVWITGYVGKEKEILIPSLIQDCPVVGIDDNAFENNTKLCSVVVPEGVESIGWFCFSGCIALKNVTLPKSLTSIKYGAFQNCYSKMEVHCSKGSYAEEYALSYGLPVVSIKENT